MDRFGEEILGEVPHEGQKKLINLDKKLNLILTGNRFGKTRGISFKHLYRGLYKIGLETDNAEDWLNAEYKTLNCSYEYKIAQKVFDNIERLINQSPYLRMLVENIDRQKRVIKFVNNYEFHYASLEENGKHVEGEPYKYISVDEAGWEKNLRNIYYYVLLMRTAGINGIIDMVGTPKPDTDIWLEQKWERAIKGVDEDTGTLTGSTYDNIYLSKDEITEIEKQYEDYPHLRDMAIWGKFIHRLHKLLTRVQIENAIDEALPAKSDDRKFMWGTVPFIEGHRYISFWDIAFESDWTVGVTLDVTSIPYIQVNLTRVNKHNIPSWQDIFHLMAQEVERYHLKQVWWDASTPTGGALQEDLKRLNIPARPLRITAGGNEFDGYTVSKIELVTALEMAFCYRQPTESDDPEITWGKVRIPRIQQQVDELSLYHREDKRLETDCVIALAGALTVAERYSKPLKVTAMDMPSYLRGSYI